MNIKDYKNFLEKITKNLKQIDLNSVLDDLKSIKIDDIKNINYRRLFYDVRNSQYLKPSIGILGASFFTIFLFIPSIEAINTSFKNAKKYKYESSDLPNKISKLENENLKFEEIKLKMSEINSSFLKKKDIIFISQLMNETAKKTNVNINTFSPILRPDSSKLCKESTFQKQSKNFKAPKKSNLRKKGFLVDNYFEVTFKSDYLDMIRFFKEIQQFDIMVVPHCFEVNSQQKASSSNNEDYQENDSIIIPLNEEYKPLISANELDKINIDPNMGVVETKVVFKIPSFNK